MSEVSRNSKEMPDFKDETCLRLVHATILVDTVALSPEAKKVTPLDNEMVEKCETLWLWALRKVEKKFTDI